MLVEGDELVPFELESMKQLAGYYKEDDCLPAND